MAINSRKVGSAFCKRFDLMYSSLKVSKVFSSVCSEALSPLMILLRRMSQRRFSSASASSSLLSLASWRATCKTVSGVLSRVALMKASS